MKTVFEIGNAAMECDTLLLEIGENYCCYALLNGPEKKFYRLKYTTYDESEGLEKLKSVLAELRDENCRQVVISSAFSFSLLIPMHYNGGGHRLLNTIYDLSAQKQLMDDISGWQMQVSYSIPQSIFNLLTEQFSSIQFFHTYTTESKAYNGLNEANQLSVHFTTQHFRVLLNKNNQVHLAQTYSYKTPLDVVYFLLKICYEFEISQSKILVIISGLIDKDSALYTELHNYFLNLQFAENPVYSLPESEHPHYYFTSLYNLAACVS